jgi:putative colanic acid biosynthesis UDP-glucose lipid carrier transferase
MIKRDTLDIDRYQWIKRGFDIVFSLCVLLTVFPILYVLFGILIKLSSPGPIIFKQKRTGLHGAEFNCYKFRSMRLNKEAHEVQAAKNDPRTTRVGHFLRHSNLDEIPQFWNVLQGDMSVVGPRPHMLKHTEYYSKIIDNYMDRHLVKPGVTGWAQVKGFNGSTQTLDQMTGRVRLDLWYVQNWSFGLDLKIIGITISNLFISLKNKDA